MQDKSVVVNLSQFERPRRVQVSAESLTTLHGCRDQLIESTTRALTHKTEAMENTLLAMAERSPLLETRNAYYNAQGVLNKQANALMSACKDAYVKAFNNFVQGRDNAEGGALSELSLMGDEDFEITLALDKASARMQFNCAEELVALDARIAKLLGRTELGEKDNPLSPRMLCDALLDGMTSLQLEQNVQVVLLNQFDLVLTGELAPIYQSLNRYLVERGILPELKAGTKPHARTPASPADSASPATPAGDDITKLFEQLAGGAGSGKAAVAGFSLLESLGQLQMGSSMMLPGGASFEMPLLDANAIHNVLRSLQQSPAMQAASPLDAVLVDAVAMLFDVVFDETNIPDRLKAQIARLQIPVLKAAMLDRNFFSQPNHPVRRMLDATATLAIHLPENEAGNARLDAISQVVSRVLDSFEKDIAVFDAAATELESMGAALEHTLEETTEAGLQEDIAQIKQAERAELAPVIVLDLINRALADQPAEANVQEFLRRDWARLLTLNYIKDGEEGPLFNSHVETMRELVWSVQPKDDMDARLMLVRILPGLLKRLREGVAEIELPQKLSDRFFATLVILHANAVRPNTQPVPLPDITPEEIEEIAAQPDAEATAAMFVPAEAEAEPAEPEYEDEHFLRARALSKGDWVEFNYEDGTFRWARLGWVSGVRNTYLFSDQDGMNSFSISLNRLADKLRRGEAELVERRSITESAFGKLMNLFRQKLGKA